MSAVSAPCAALPPVELVITAAESGERLDRVVSARPLGFTRATVQRWIEEGRVEVAGAVVRASTRVRYGQRVVVRPAPPPPTRAEPEAIALTVLFEDEHLLVVDKPAGLVVHPAPGHASGTLVNALLHHAKLADEDETRRPGIVHRLDRDTSGVLVVAKTDVARLGLVALFAAHDIERVYRAILVGAPPDTARWETLHGRHPVDRKRFTTKIARGKRAVTTLRVVERLYGSALCEARLETGRTHQIRVHAAEHGVPVLADPVYGRTPRDARVAAVARELGRQALHAAVLGFEHPVTHRALRFESPLPDDFARALAALR